MSIRKLYIFIVSSAAGIAVCFAIVYWLFHFNLKDSIGVSIGGVLASYLVSSLFKFLQRKKAENKYYYN